MYKKINLIQHIGTGVPDSEASWKWYRKFFGLDIPMFDAVAEAPLMQRYTNNDIVNKRATMVLNIQGGCAMEIIELKNFKCRPSVTGEHQLGDYGIFITKVRSQNILTSFEFFKKNNITPLTGIKSTPDNKKTFYVKDPNGLIFQVIEDSNFFTRNGHVSGGIAGCMIGVSDIEKSKKLYCTLLGFDQIIYDKTEIFDDWKNENGYEGVPGNGSKVRRALLCQSKGPFGIFSLLAGPAYIELIQVFDRTPSKILEGRIWGELGFIHLGFDVKGMSHIEKECAEQGYPFTCDSRNALKMGNNTEVHCTYIEDPDGTLIELIEVYRIPIVKKIGWSLNLEKRDPQKPLPSWILKGLKFARVKD